MTIAATPVITLPNWPNYRRANDAEKRVWDDMITALRRHEREHDQIFRAQIARYKEQLEGYTIALPPAEMRRDWQTFCAEVDAAQQQFDRETRHGERDGVRLDLPDAAP